MSPVRRSPQRSIRVPDENPRDDAADDNMDQAGQQQHQRIPNDDNEVTVNAARAVKLPPFWKENPVL
ncbi:hypothetical protein M0804_001364 [Polistes exclamans]|nr:hypothetical protein M0804_001364 [Polistes exclamans]